MNLLEMSAVAVEYYESYRSKTLVSGFEKYILTDGENCLFVDSSILFYDLRPGSVVFKLDTRQGVTGCHIFMKCE